MTTTQIIKKMVTIRIREKFLSEGLLCMMLSAVSRNV